MNLKIKLCLSLWLCLVFGQIANAEKRRVLMIGNSYIYTNDLPTVLKSLSLSFGDTLEIQSAAPGGYSFNQHSNDANTLALIQQGNWDYVVLQAQSQEPSFPPSQVSSQTYPYAKKLDSLVHVSNPCAETLFFMTWGKKNGDAGNCASYPILCTYAGVYSRLRESYLEMSQLNSATCVPVGAAWNQIIVNQPNIELFNPDGSHPSVNGTYLAACTFYSSIFHKNALGSSYVLNGVTANDATLFQNVAFNIVNDSLETWNQFGKLPFASFGNTNVSNQFTFNNQSLRSNQYEWNFGDGSAISNTMNTTHTYASAGTYVVSLKAKNTCGKYDIFSKSVTIAPNGIPAALYNKPDFYVSQKRLYLQKIDSDFTIQIIDMQGKKVWQQQGDASHQTIDLSVLPNGLYHCNLYLSNQKSLSISHKIMLN